MSRPLRIEFPGAIYHVTSRGDRREPIYRDDADRRSHLDVLAAAMDRFDAQLLAYCLMGNHFHLVLHTRAPNLSRLMRHANGVYTQQFNRRHGLVGHLFQGRFKAILVDRDAYLLALCRYVERNPVAAGIAAEPAQWAWSSCRAHAGLEATPPWLDTDGLHGYLLGSPVTTARQRQQACRRYAALVSQADKADAGFWQDGLRGQIYLGDESFAERMQAQVETGLRQHKQIPRVQRLPQRCWADWLAACDGDRPLALARAYREGGLTMTQLAQDTGLSVSHISRLVRAGEQRVAGEGKGET
ncbi:MAG: transposase [Rubrivivax sp.]|nr:transposase [Rubrivivax sp.]